MDSLIQATKDGDQGMLKTLSGSIAFDDDDDAESEYEEEEEVFYYRVFITPSYLA